MTTPQNPASARLDQLVRAEPLPPVLRPTTIRPGRGGYAPFTHLLLLDHGEAGIETDTSPRQIEGPAAAILPPGESLLLQLGPGCGGWLLGMAPSMLAAAVGVRAESEFLAPIGTQLLIAPSLPAGTAPDPFPLAERIGDELSGGAAGAHMAVLACLRLIVLDIWRGSGVQPELVGRGSEIHVLQAFRRLVELHFRSRLGVGDYADLLGVSYERLHRICRRNLQHSPLQLIHRRMMREAADWLERSGRSVQQIAHLLGFHDSAEFSHFFKRNSGLSPSAYRQQVRNHSAASRPATTSFADWP